MLHVCISNFAGDFKKMLINSCGSCSLIRQHCGCFASNTCELNDCHTPELTVSFKIVSKIARVMLHLGGTLGGTVVVCRILIN